MLIKNSNLSSIVIVLSLLAGGAAADTPTQRTISGGSGSSIQVADAAGEAAEGKKKRTKNTKKICTRERVTGTHFRQRICRTQAQIDARKEADERMLNDIQINGGAAGGRP